MSHAHFDHAQLDSLIVFQATEYTCLLSASRYATGAVEYHWPRHHHWDSVGAAPAHHAGTSDRRGRPALALALEAAHGRLPGDVVVDRPGFKLFAPFTTMIIVSLVVSLIVWLLRRWRERPEADGARQPLL